MQWKMIGTMTLVMAGWSLGGCGATASDKKLLAQGFADYEAHRVDEAQAAATKFIEKNLNAENLDEAYYLRGLTEFTKGDRPGAAQDLQIAIGKSKREDLKGKSYGILGEMAFNGQRWEQALDYFKSTLECYPAGQAPVAVYFRIGATLQAMGQWEKARPYLDRAIALKPDAVMLQRAIQRRNATSFALQYGAYKEGPRAREAADQLRAAGINSMIASEMREGQLLFMVRSGSYRTFDEADFARQQLVAKYPLVTVVP